MTRALFAHNWWDDGLQPLYRKNLIVSFLVNTLVPECVELLVDEHRLMKLLASVPASKKVTYVARLAAHFDSVRVAAERSHARKVTPDFAKMRDAMVFLVTDPVVKSGFDLLFESSKTARTVVGVFVERLVDALDNHSKIEVSNDLPFHILALA
jgi:hypothetical protein